MTVWLAFTKSGAMADVTQASKEIGKKYHEKTIENIVKFVKWLKEMDV